MENDRMTKSKIDKDLDQFKEVTNKDSKALLQQELPDGPKQDEES